MAGALVVSMMYPIMIVTQHCDRQILIDGYGSLATAPSAARRQSVRCEPVFEGWESAS
jgi:hypothetical protein